eukprot:1925956-Pyramimonas_sp.AAC.1
MSRALPTRAGQMSTFFVYLRPRLKEQLHTCWLAIGTGEVQRRAAGAAVAQVEQREGYILLCLL